ncbi:hypothetical protein FG05_13842 [Fusarium graminearum]|nr:hypothetical protein FG05_13842 [Fusarium graminearum]
MVAKNDEILYVLHTMSIVLPVRPDTPQTIKRAYVFMFDPVSLLSHAVSLPSFMNFDICFFIDAAD